MTRLSSDALAKDLSRGQKQVHARGCIFLKTSFAKNGFVVDVALARESGSMPLRPRISDLSGSAAQHGQFKLTPDVPTAALRHTEASVALGGNCPEGAHTHSGEHVCNPTAALRM